MAFFILLTAATETGVVSATLRFGVPERLLRLTAVIVTTIRAVHVRFGRFGLGFHHTACSWVNSGLVYGQLSSAGANLKLLGPYRLVPA